MKVINLSLRLAATRQRPEELKRGRGKSSIKPEYKQDILLSIPSEQYNQELLKMAVEALDQLASETDRLLGEIRENPEL